MLKSSSGVHEVELTSRAGRLDRRVGKVDPGEDGSESSESSERAPYAALRCTKCVSGVERGVLHLGRKCFREGVEREGTSLLNS